MKELNEIQKRLKAPKGQYNAFGKYKYRSAEDILEAVKPIYIEQNCTLTISDSIELVGERYYVKATAKLTNSEGVSVETSAYAREDLAKKGMDEAQITGSTSSYARKYALNGLFAIDDEKDPDTTNTHGKGETTQQTNQQVKTATSTAVDEAQLAIAIDDLKRATNRSQLETAYYNWAGAFGKNEKFKAVLAEMGNKYPSPNKK